MIPLRRGAGLVMPIGSLPGPGGGRGDFSSAVRWLKWMQAAGVRYWQILPLTIPDSVGSPFASPSAEAMNPDVLSLRWLAEQGLMTGSEARAAHQRPRTRRRQELLRRAWTIWQTDRRSEQTAFLQWQKKQSWLQPYCAYQAIKDHFGGRPWWRWPKKWRRGRSCLDRLTTTMRTEAEFHAWIQWQVACQWQLVRRAARRAGVIIIGDLPFYVQHDSVDVWLRPELFSINQRGALQDVSGAAPDIFSPAGQKWGTPVYRWRAHQQENWAWWKDRVAQALATYDIVRFDHFPGLQATWHVPVRARTGAAGRWVPSPGRALLRAIRRQVGSLPFIAEDLGRVSKFISTLRKDFSVPGSRVLQFAWSGLPNNVHEPRRVETNMVYYTANHDTNTTLGWLQHEAHQHERERLKEYYGSVAHLPEKFIWTVMHHRARIAMVHIADLLGLGAEARINQPGTIRHNWSWQLRRWPSRQKARRFRQLVITSRRGGRRTR